jgi:hypothetical protein
MLPGSVNPGREAVKNFVAAAAFLSGGKRIGDTEQKGYSIRHLKDEYPDSKRLLDAG